MNSWRPFLSVILSTIDIFGLQTDFLMRKLGCYHMSLSGCFLFVLVSNVQESFVEVLLGCTKGEAKVFITDSTRQEEKGLQHGQSQVVVVLTSRHKFTSILSEVGCKRFEVFSRILGWMPSFDLDLQVFETFDRGRLNSFNQV